MTYSKYQFSAFRIVFGIYLFIHFAMLVPFGAEMFGPGGTLATPDLNFTYGLFPSIFFFPFSDFLTGVSSSSAITSILIGFCILSLIFALGLYRRVVAFFLWFAWASLFNANNFISNPGLPYVGWLLLACAIIPSGEPLAFAQRRDDWELPKELYWGAWILLALGYSVSGVGKALSPSWQDGTAFLHLIQNPLARDYWFRDFMLSLPIGIHKILTWGALFFELSFAPLCVFALGRKFAWGMMIAMHIGILCLLSFADLTIGMLMIHLFTLDPSWFKPRFIQQSSERPVVFFDGVCGLCNNFVDFLFEEDTSQRYRFSPLQSEFAQQSLSAEALSTDSKGDFQSVILLEDGKVYYKSSAALRILTSLGGFWIFMFVFYLVPTLIRDKVYMIVAEHRYLWFGKKETCRMPTPAERQRFVL